MTVVTCHPIVICRMYEGEGGGEGLDGKSTSLSHRSCRHVVME